VINAGDGSHEHPTQGLLDLFTMREHFTKAGRLPARGEAGKESELFAGLHVAIVGDIANSRVARSNLHGLCKLGAKVTLVGPSTLVPGDIRRICPKMADKVTIAHDLDAVLPHVDVVNMLRIQFERLTSSAFPSVREYSRFFGLTRERMERARKDVLVLHPGPMNRGLEINTEVADGRHSAILQQVTNGLAVRMAVLYLCVGANTVLRGQRG
jgi:aspartate carbamoyltransferase catalytic subunit